MNAQPAIRSRVEAVEYRAIPAVSITSLKELKRSPLHYRHRLAQPKTSEALTLGTAAHVATLEPERFERDYAIWTSRTSSGRMSPRSGKAWEAFVEENGGRTILTEDEADTAQAIAKAVRGDPIASAYLEHGEPEVSMEWMLGDRRCKGRADWLSVNGEHVLVGLKSARDCRPYIFGSAAAKLGYHLQWAFYRDGYEIITGEAPRMVEIVVESEAPHAVVVYTIPNDIIEQGREEYQDLLKTLAECEAKDEWPGPAVEEQFLTLPSWAYARQEDISDLGLEV